MNLLNEMFSHQESRNLEISIGAEEMQKVVGDTPGTASFLDLPAFGAGFGGFFKKKFVGFLAVRILYGIHGRSDPLLRLIHFPVQYVFILPSDVLYSAPVWSTGTIVWSSPVI